MAGIKGWVKNLKNMVENPWDTAGDADHPECPRCESTMNFHGHDDDGDFPLGEGYWKCPNCGFKITENEL